MPSADAWLESAIRILIAKNGIQVRGPSGAAHLAHATVDAARQMGEQCIQAERVSFQTGLIASVELAEFLLEPFELRAASRARFGASERKMPAIRDLGVGRRTIVIVRTHLVSKCWPSGGVLNLSLAVERRADRIGKGPARIFDARIADEIDVVLEAVVQTRKRTIALGAMRVEFLHARRVEVEPGALEGRQEGAVLHRDGVVVDGNSVIELIGQARAVCRAYVLNP